MEKTSTITTDRAGSRLSSRAGLTPERGTSRLVHHSIQSKSTSVTAINQAAHSTESAHRFASARHRQSAKISNWVTMVGSRALVILKKIGALLRPTGGSRWVALSVMSWVFLGLFIWSIPPPTVANWLGFQLYLPLVLLVGVTSFSTIRLYRPVGAAVSWTLLLTLGLIARLQHIEVSLLVIIGAIGVALFFDLGLHLVHRD